MTRARERWKTFWRASTPRSRPPSGDPSRPVPPAAERVILAIIEWREAESPIAGRGLRVALDRPAETIGEQWKRIDNGCNELDVSPSRLFVKLAIEALDRIQ